MPHVHRPNALTINLDIYHFIFKINSHDCVTGKNKLLLFQTGQITIT